MQASLQHGFWLAAFIKSAAANFAVALSPFHVLFMSICKAHFSSCMCFSCRNRSFAYCARSLISASTSRTLCSAAFFSKVA